jgi:hypothetical protein
MLSTFRLNKAYRTIEQTCLASGETDPLTLALAIMAKQPIAVNGPEHHFLVPAVLLTCCLNVQGRRDELPEKLKTARKRAKTVPGGNCGNCGTCGAAVGTGIFISVFTGTDPFTEGEAWKNCNMMTSKSLEAIAGFGGPRCCKRDSYTALRTAAAFLKENYQIELPLHDVKCPFSGKNEECKKEACPYYPKK